MINARELFGDIDIYLFDQILKNQFTSQMKILDAGCGRGRNLVYFLRIGCEVFGIDQNPEAVQYTRELAKVLNSQSLPDNFRVSKVEKMPFPDLTFEAIISSAVLHFAANENHFKNMLEEMWRVLKPDGLLFVRLASSIGIEDKIKTLGNRRYNLPDGSERFLVDEGLLLDLTKNLGGKLIEPIKTTNVQNLRCMTTWVVRKENT
jgi:ubiquinone/menaquinone biosynthesis C-methylase UbiE